MARITMLMVWTDVAEHRTYVIQDGFARLYRCPRSCTETPNNSCKGVREVMDVFGKLVDMPLLDIEQCTEY